MVASFAADVVIQDCVDCVSGYTVLNYCIKSCHTFSFHALFDAISFESGGRIAFEVVAYYVICHTCLSGFRKCRRFLGSTFISVQI